MQDNITYILTNISNKSSSDKNKRCVENTVLESIFSKADTKQGSFTKRCCIYGLLTIHIKTMLRKGFSDTASY